MTLLGDVDESGVVNIMDAVLLARITGDDDDLPVISGTAKANSDIVADGRTDANDLAKLMRYLARYIDKL